MIYRIQYLYHQLRQAFWALVLAYMLAMHRAYREEELDFSPAVWEIRPETSPDHTTDHTFFFAWLQEHAPKPTISTFRRIEC